jgi:hypothetical protein
MKIHIKSFVNIPEIPPEVELEKGTLRDVFVKIFSGLQSADEMIDSSTGEIKYDGIFEALLNNEPYYSLPQGFDTELHDGDTVTLSLVMLGGG